MVLNSIFKLYYISEKYLFFATLYSLFDLELSWSFYIALTVLLAVNESGVSPVSKRYMRAGIGNDRLLVCLSEYLP